VKKRARPARSRSKQQQQWRPTRRGREEWESEASGSGREGGESSARDYPRAAPASRAHRLASSPSPRRTRHGHVRLGIQLAGRIGASAVAGTPGSVPAPARTACVCARCGFTPDIMACAGRGVGAAAAAQRQGMRQCRRAVCTAAEADKTKPGRERARAGGRRHLRRWAARSRLRPAATAAVAAAKTALVHPAAPEAGAGLQPRRAWAQKAYRPQERPRPWPPRRRRARRRGRAGNGGARRCASDRGRARLRRGGRRRARRWHRPCAG